eukprot:CAMPEP_0171574268 /NCGR_PEP_ID=MMETSP0961-20121227/5252_1 /TAXON_ID=87120 /ORGANISM="Aurantiochytrium limacinum, Strain ATCCMYA-1381" /LENGTH=186 /DNA_ID=CAMNT_0012129543 /DNA_START=36 /DNA_END=596 /DNA_ORIENTATION=-
MTPKKSISMVCLLVGLLAVTTARGHGLPLDTTRPALTEGRGKRIVDVLLRVGAEHEAGHVHHLLADTDVALADENTGVVDALGKALLEDLGLETALKETLGGELKDEIQLLLVLGEETVANHTAEEGLTLEHTALVLLVKSQELTGGSTDLGKDELGAPDLALAAKAILTAELELLLFEFLSSTST